MEVEVWTPNGPRSDLTANLKFMVQTTALAKKTSARLRAFAPSTVASSRNLADVFLANAVYIDDQALHCDDRCLSSSYTVRKQIKQKTIEKGTKSGAWKCLT